MRACAAHEHFERHTKGGLDSKGLRMFYDLKINFDDEIAED